MSRKRHLPFGVKICSAICAAVVALTLPNAAFLSENSASGSTSIDDLQAQIDKIKKENEARKKQIDGLNGDINENKASIKLINEHIDGVTLEIEKYGELILAQKQSIDDKQIEIENVEREVQDREIDISNKKAYISELEAKNKENLRRFGELARAMYINDVSDTIPILSGSDDWYDYFVYSDVIENISTQNLNFMKKLLADIKDQEKLIEDLKADINTLEQEKAELSEEKTQLENDMAALKSSKAELDSYAAQQKAYLQKLAQQNKELLDKVSSLQYDEKESIKKMDELNKELEELIRLEQEKNNGQPNYSADGFIWPVSSKFKRISTYFGYDPWRNGQHRGLDIVGSTSSIAGAEIRAVQSGTVITVYTGCPHNYGKQYSCGCGGGYGNYIIIDHGGGISTMYAHCQKINVTKGQQIKQGDVIGNVGTTGWSTGYHLHFEVRVNGVAVDPFKYEYTYY